MILRARHLSKSFKRRRVVADVSLEIQQGDVVGLLGPNGSGKTTTFFMIVGLVRPDAGEIELGERALGSLPIFERARLGLGYLPQEPSVFRKLTVEENLLLVLDNWRVSRSEKRERVERLLGELGVDRLAKQRAFTLSGGERRRLEIARALILEPKFLLLDEPYAGIDPLAVQGIQAIILGLKKKNIGVVITDHNVREALSACDSAYLIKDGKIWIQGTPKEVVENDAARRFYLGEGFTL